MPDRDYPAQPCPTAPEDDAGAEPADAKALRGRLAAREIAIERFRKLKEKLLAASDIPRRDG